MRTFDNIRDTLYELTEEALKGCTRVSARDLGLDDRAADSIYVCMEEPESVHEAGDYIMVSKADDRTMQYYGGFEYVGKDCRTELGDYVLYSAMNGRVAEHLEQLADKNTED